MTELPRALRPGDWTAQGLPFYSGSVGYRVKVAPVLGAGERLFVEVPDYRGAAVRVWVNGRPAGVIGWQPNEVDITDSLPEPGIEVELMIEVIGHRRNSHGPLHCAQQWPMWTGPDTFVTQGSAWTDAYTLVPCGLMQAPVLVTRQLNTGFS